MKTVSMDSLGNPASRARGRRLFLRQQRPVIMFMLEYTDDSICATISYYNILYIYIYIYIYYIHTHVLP